MRVAVAVGVKVAVGVAVGRGVLVGVCVGVANRLATVAKLQPVAMTARAVRRDNTVALLVFIISSVNWLGCFWLRI